MMGQGVPRGAESNQCVSSKVRLCSPLVAGSQFLIGASLDYPQFLRLALPKTLHARISWVSSLYIFLWHLSDIDYVQNCSKKYRCLKKLLRLLLGGVGWCFGRMFARQGNRNQTKCMEFRPIKENSNFWTSIFCPGINFSCSKSLWIWWTIDPLILACLKLMTYASFSTKELLAVLMDGNPCTNGWNSMHQNRKNVIASCFFEQSCLRQVKIQDPWQK